MKKRTTLLTLSHLPALLLALLLTAGCGGQKPAETPALDETDLEILVAQTLLDRAGSGHLSGECVAEGHQFLGVVQEEARLWQVYLLASVGQYGFCTGHFECVSGSGAIPTRMTFTADEKGALTLADYWEPEDGSGYPDSIKETFPPEFWDEAFAADEYYDELCQQKEAYARAYLESIGREAQIGEYRDFEHPLFTDQGMTVEASNALLEIEDLYPFPYFIGSTEQLEDGVRYVYETAWDHQGNGMGTATYTKTDYATGQILQQFTYQVAGDQVMEQTLHIEVPEGAL